MDGAAATVEVIMSSYDLVVAGANKVLSCGNYICIQIPLGALSAYWKAQMFFVTLPYRCALRLLNVLRHIISEFVGPPIQQTTQEILHEFLFRESSERNGLIKSIQEIREHTIVAVQKIETFKEELNRCRYKVHEWKTETERRAKEMTELAKEEKKLLRVVIAALKHLRKLKGSRTVLDENFKDTLEELVNFSRSLSQKREELSESAVATPGMINGSLKSAYNRLQNQANQLKEVTEKRRKALDRVTLASPELTSSEINALVDASSPKQASVTDSELVSIGMDTLQSVVYVLNAENALLKRRLKLTNDQLRDVKATSECLADKVNELQLHLDNVKELLRTTEEERDGMCFKLLLLNEMIEEQEELLNEASQGDSINSSYQTAPDPFVNEFLSAVAANSELRSCGTSFSEYEEH